MSTSLTSDATKHFSHVLQKKLCEQECIRSRFGILTCTNKGPYELIHKKDASLMIPGITDNNNVRTRIYKKLSSSLTIHAQCKISNSSGLGHISELSVNRSAIMHELVTRNSNGKEYKIILVNTELSTSKKGNLGLSTRRNEFISLIKEFELHKRYNEGYNIFFCGSLNFKLFSPKITNNINRELLTIMNQSIINEKNNNKLLKRNELKMYMDELISEFSNKNTENKYSSKVYGIQFNNNLKQKMSGIILETSIKTLKY